METKKKKPIRPSNKTLHPKHEKKPKLNGLIKLLRPKVYITDSSNFKNLVQELTGNASPPLTSIMQSADNNIVAQDHHHLGYHEDNSLELPFEPYSTSYASAIPPDLLGFTVDSSFDSMSTASPDLLGLSTMESFNSHVSVEKCEDIDQFSSQYLELEDVLMGMDYSNNYDASWYGMRNDQQEICVYDYDLSTFI